MSKFILVFGILALVLVFVNSLKPFDCLVRVIYIQEALLSYFPWMWDLVSITSCLIARGSASLSLLALLSMLVSGAEQEKIIKE